MSEEDWHCAPSWIFDELDAAGLVGVQVAAAEA
jgi:hypothetical protein